ncbi:MAG: hypothetical protein EOO68_35895, partial [Moraxellaceae bacterium]
MSKSNDLKLKQLPAAYVKKVVITLTMENKEPNDWRQEESDDKSEVREGKSSLDQLNNQNDKREHGDWRDNQSKGNGDYGSEEGRSDAGVTGGETDISRPYAGDDRIIDDRGGL